MIHYVIEAAEYFFSMQVNMRMQTSDNPINDDGYISSIIVDTQDGPLTVYLSYSEALLKTLVEKMLFESDPSSNDLIDMANEATNLIVGSAKNVAIDNGVPMFNIHTPIYITKKAIDFPFDFARVIENEAHSLIVAIKE